MDIRTYEMTLRGASPLLLHRDDIDWADKMEAWKNDPRNKKLSKAGDDRTPAFRWIGCVYHDDNLIGIETENFQKCLMEGGAMVPVPGGRGGKTFKAQTQSGLAVAGEGRVVPILINGKTLSYKKLEALMDEPSFAEHEKAALGLGFELKKKRAEVSGRKHIRVRPMFTNWAFVLRLSVWDDQLTEEALEDIVKFSGQYKGIGDWRPSSKKSPGPYGRFKLEGMKKVS